MKVVAFQHRQGTPLLLPPGISLYADSAIVWPGHPLFLPDFDANWSARIMLAFRISRLGKGVAEKFASRYFDAMTLALLPQSVVLDNELQATGRQTGLCGCFDGAVAMGQWLELPADDAPLRVSVGDITDTIQAPLSGAAQAIAALSHYSTIKTGDIVMPQWLVPQITLEPPSVVSCSIEGKEVMSLRIR